MRSSVATGPLRDAAQQVGAVEADVNRAALEVVLQASRPLEGADLAPALEQLAGALGGLAGALQALWQGLEAAAAYDAADAQAGSRTESSAVGAGAP